MSRTQSLSITLPHDMARMVKDKVASGEYASESEVVREGLRSLAARDEAVERWLSETVVPTYDAHKAAPDKAKPIAEVKARLEAFIADSKAQARHV